MTHLRKLTAVLLAVIMVFALAACGCMMMLLI